MIQIQELRIGNWVLCQQSYAVVTQILAPDLLDLRCEDGCNRFCNIGDVSPIELSPEVLAKCGFQKEEDEWWRTWHGQFREELWLCELENGSFALSHDHYFTLHEGVSSVHMLQNAFWIVTGQELSFTP